VRRRETVQRNTTIDAKSDMSTTMERRGGVTSAAKNRARPRQWVATLRRLDPELGEHAAWVCGTADGGGTASALPVESQHARSVHDFAHALAGRLFGLVYPDERPFEVLLAYVLDREDAQILRYARQVADAIRRWSVGEVEAKIGTRLDAAYRRGGVTPFWAVQVGADGEVVVRNVAKYREREPAAFLNWCLQGAIFDDAPWSTYARELFGSPPDGFKSLVKAVKGRG
jgi:hypothetical protein